jgi:hypothetical protein
MFHRGDFHWQPSRFLASKKNTEKQIENVLQILNDLTPAQEEAVRLFGKSCFEDGIEAGVDLARHDD